MPTPKRRCWISCTRQGLGVRGVELDPHSRGGLCGRSLGLPCARNNNPVAGQSQAHEQFVVPLWKHVCERAENTRDTERERGREQQQQQKDRKTAKGTPRPEEEKLLHSRADIPKRTEAHGGAMPEQKERVTINLPCHSLLEWRDLSVNCGDNKWGGEESAVKLSLGMKKEGCFP